MLVNAEKISWTESELLQDIFIKKVDFDDYMFLRLEGVEGLPKILNEYDDIKSDTILLHDQHRDATKVRNQLLQLGAPQQEESGVKHLPF